MLSDQSLRSRLRCAAGRMASYRGLTSDNHGAVNEEFFARLLREADAEIGRLERAEKTARRRHMRTTDKVMSIICSAIEKEMAPHAL